MRAVAVERIGLARKAALGLLVVAAALQTATARAEAENVLLAELVQEGVRLSNGQVERLPAPLMADGLDTKAQMAVLQRIADRHSVEALLRDSVVAPFVLKVDPVQDAGGSRVGHRISLWFAVHGGLDKIADQGLIEKIRVQNKERPGLVSTSRSLTPDELRQRNIRLKSGAAGNERYSLFDVPVLDRVQLRGVAVSQDTRSPLTQTVAAKLDPRFGNDPDFPNQWHAIRTNELGSLELGPPKPCSGFGIYVKATALVDEQGSPTGVVFIESHCVFSEPQEWFDGSNFLRSKLPLVIQDNVRAFRRELKTTAGE